MPLEFIEGEDLGGEDILLHLPCSWVVSSVITHDKKTSLNDKQSETCFSPQIPPHYTVIF